MNGMGGMRSILWEFYELAGVPARNIARLMGTSDMVGIGAC